MDNEILYRDENLLLEYVSKGNYIHETWWGLTPSSSFLKLLDIIINSLEEKNADGLILDAREHLGLLLKNQEYAAEQHKKYAKKHGFFKQAIIIPKDLFSKYSVENYGVKFEKQEQSAIRYFQDIASAEDWLQGK